MVRCQFCHRAQIPKRVKKAWKKKFGTTDKPDYRKVCKICGHTFGDHIGVLCPGKTMHYKILERTYTACGAFNKPRTQNIHQVTCLRCRNTINFKEAEKTQS